MRSKAAKVMFSQACVILSTEGCLLVCLWGGGVVCLLVCPQGVVCLPVCPPGCQHKMWGRQPIIWQISPQKKQCRLLRDLREVTPTFCDIWQNLGLVPYLRGWRPLKYP